MDEDNDLKTYLISNTPVIAIISASLVFLSVPSEILWQLQKVVQGRNHALAHVEKGRNDTSKAGPRDDMIIMEM